MRRPARLLALAMAACVPTVICLPRPALAAETEDPNLRRGRIQFKSNKYNEAVTELQIALRRNPRNGEALLWIGKAHARLSEFDKAADYLQQAIQVVPDSEEGYRELAAAYLELDTRARATGKADEAKVYLEKAESAAKTLEQRQPKEKDSWELLAGIAKHKAAVFRDLNLPDKALDQDEQALRYCAKVLEIDPNDVSTRLEEIEILYALRKFKDAERRCNELLKINDKLHQPRLILAQIRRANNDPEGAVKILSEILAAKGTVIEALLRRAELYLDLQKYEEALADANEAIRLTNKNPYANFIRGCVYMQLRKLDAGIQELQQASAGLPRHIPSHFWLARCLLMKDRVRDAIEELNTVVKLDARFVMARLVLASAHLQQGYPDGAISTLLDALHFDQKNVEVRRLLGIAYLHKNESDRAEQQFQKVLELDPESGKALQVMAGLKLSKNQVDDAVELCHRALEVDPKNADVHFLLGLAYLRKQRYDGAKAEFEHVLRLHARHPGARMNLAAIHVQLRELDLAQEQYQRCLEEDPTLAKARYNLARLYILDRKFDKAEAELTQLLKNEAERANVYLHMAELHQAKGEKDKAIQAAKTALTIDPKLLAARIFLARIYMADQAWPAALAEFDAALKENPKFAAAYEAAIVQVFLGRYAEAVQLFEKAANNDVAPASSLCGVAAALQLQGDYRGALANVASADSKKQQDPLIALQQLNVYLAQGDEGNARTLIRQALHVPEVIRDAYLSFIESFINDRAKSRAVSDALTRIIFFGGHGWHEQAEQNCNLLVKLAPDNSFAYTVLANVYLATGKPEKEINILRRLCEVAPKDFRHRVRLGKRLLDIGQLTEARKQFELATEVDPKAVEPVLQLGAYFLQMTQYDLCAEQAKKALAIEENNPKALALLASCHLAEKNIPKAKEILQRLTENKNLPKDALPRIQLAELNLLEGQIDPAIVQYKAAVESNPRSIYARMGLGQALWRKGSWRDAMDQFREALAVDATFSPALLALARACRATNRLDLALEYCEKAVGVNPADLEARFELAAIRVAQRKFDEAIAECTKILKDRPNDYRAKIAIAQALFESGERRTAIDQLTDLLKQTNPLPPAQEALVGFYRRTGEIDKAQAELEALVKATQDPFSTYSLAVLYVHKDKLDDALRLADERLKTQTQKDPLFLLVRGTALQLKGRFQEAADAFNDALGRDPKSARFASYLANAQLAAGKPADARKTIDSVQLGPELQDACRKLIDQLGPGGENARLAANALNQAALYVDGNWLTLARDHYERLLKTLPNNLTPLYLLANVYERLGDRPKCAETYQRILQLSPGYEPILLRLASLHSLDKNFDAAATVFRRMLEKKPDDVRLQLNLATVLQRQKKTPEATDLYKRILKQDPNNAVAYNNLGWICATETKDLKEAETLANKAAELADADSAAGAAIRDTLAWIFYLTERYDKALDMSRQALDGMPGSAEVHYHAGMIYFKKGLRASAARHLLTALRLDPELAEKDEVNKILDRIRERKP
jgi:tetratricopeptide (TPR) repeat protein